MRRVHYPEIEEGDVQLQTVVSELDRLGHLARSTTVPAEDDARIRLALEVRARQLRIAQQRSGQGRRSWLHRVAGDLRARRVPVSIIGMAASAALAWTLVVGPLVTGQQGASAAAAVVLRAAARTAAMQSSHALQPGEFAYTRSQEANFDETNSPAGSAWGFLMRTDREIWVALDGSGRIRQTSQTPVFLSPGDRSRWVAAGSPSLTEYAKGETYDRTFAPGGLAYPLNVDGMNQAELLRLENDPTALSNAIRAVASQNSNPLGYEMLTIVGDLLGESAAPAELRASLYQVASTIPRIQLVGTVHDRAGRQGVGVEVGRDDQNLELIFDPNTSALLAKEETLRRPVSDTSAPPGTVLGYTLYLRSGIVSSSSAIPTSRYRA